MAASATVPLQSFNVCHKSRDGFQSPRTSMCSSGCNHCRFEGQTRFCISVVVELFHVPLRHIGLEERAQHDQISFSIG